MSNVRPAADKPKAPPLGVFSGAQIEGAFIGLLYTMAALLAVLSVFGTFYGLLGRSAPLDAPWLAVGDVARALPVAVGALILQAVLTVLQWGARQLASRNARWWLLYLAVLALSVYYNLVAYYEPAVALGMPWLWAGILIAAGDAVPELVAVRR